MKVYRVYDTEKQEYWSSWSKTLFSSIGGAKKAWGTPKWQGVPERFNDQTRFVIHEFTLSNPTTVS